MFDLSWSLQLVVYAGIIIAAVIVMLGRGLWFGFERWRQPDADDERSGASGGGWWVLHAFLTLGAVLEALHGFKIGPYLDAGYETRRFMWTLSHAHGTLLIPLGFFLGGVVFYAGDPGLGVLLVPAGAMLLFLAVLLTARGAATMSVAAPRERGDAQPERTRNGKRRK